MTDSESNLGELREFVYINDQSVNGHLSSMGVGLETGAERSEEESEGREGKFSGKINIPGFPLSGGGEQAKSQQSSENVETQINITMPYRFQTLVEVIDKSGIKIKTPEGPLESKDIIEIEGTVSPMSSFRLELGEGSIISMGNVLDVMKRTFRELQENEGSKRAQEALKNIDESISEDSHVEVNEAAVEIAKTLTENRVPVRIETDYGTFGALLDRDSFRVPISHAFGSTRSYSVFGRVEGAIRTGEKWEPVDEIRHHEIFGQEGSDSKAVQSFRESIKQISEGHGLTMEDEHLAIEGPAKIIHPIAIYW